MQEGLAGRIPRPLQSMRHDGTLRNASLHLVLQSFLGYGRVFSQAILDAAHLIIFFKEHNL
jgi:hypothetical protein